MDADDQQFHPNRWSDRQFRETEPRHAHDGETGDDFEAWQSAFRDDLREALGFPVVEARGDCDLAPKRLETEQLHGYERQKWVVETEPGFHVPFYLLVPDGEEPPHPVVLAVHGHNETGKELYVGRYRDEEERRSIAEGERDIAVQAVERGYAAVAPDMRGFGELANPDDRREGRGHCRTMQLHAQLFGRTLVGDRAWDATRLVDFVERRPELDGDRVAITGNSGGGTVSLFAGAVDERLSPVVPSSYFCTFADSIGSVHHCACNYVPGVARLGEMWDLAGLVAPRPFRAVAGRDDEIFPVEATRRAFDELQSIYGAAGAGERCSLYVGDGGHRYYADGAWPFVEAHL
ncbi:MAG: alpha/beta hydrolase family protein [Halobacteriaceae archaeon]